MYCFKGGFYTASGGAKRLPHNAASAVVARPQGLVAIAALCHLGFIQMSKWDNDIFSESETTNTEN